MFDVEVLLVLGDDVLVEDVQVDSYSCLAWRSKMTCRLVVLQVDVLVDETRCGRGGCGKAAHG